MPVLNHEQFLRERHFPSLDGVRGLSVLAVVWHHTAPAFSGVAASQRGFLGVDMFFVLSGFLIVTLLLREQDRYGRVSLKDFYVRRSLRIFPLYYGLLLALAAVVLVAPGLRFAPEFFEDLPYLATYTSNWVHVAGLLGITWSLAAEEQFYLVWPPIERFLRRAVLLILAGAILINQAINFQLVDAWFPPGARHADLEILQITFTPILLGVGLAHLLHRRESYARWVSFFGSPWLPAVCIAALLGLASVPGDISGAPRLGIHLVLVVLLASLVVRRDTLGGLLTTFFVRRFGAVSYGVYLLHMFVLHFVNKALERSPLRFPLDQFVLCTLATWAAAEISYFVYEKRFLELKHRFSRVPRAAVARA
jgi:peptidoglycan/LPS O-acetylase OafA/YrhL